MVSKELTKEAKQLSKEMTEFGEKYMCKKCSEDWCQHMLSARGKKFGKRVRGWIEKLAVENGVEMDVKTR